MLSLYIIFALIFGIFIGSFINVLVLRLGTGRSIVKGRSVCLSCGIELRAIDLIPVASFVLLRARCRNCRSLISFQYPAVELLNGMLYALVFYRFFSFENLMSSILLTLALWAVSSLLLAILVYDIRHKIIPNGLVFALTIISALVLFFDTYSAGFILPDLWMILAAPIVALPLFLFWLLSAGRWMGLGDAKLVWSFGWILGITKGFTAVILGFWIGALVALSILLIQKLANRGSLNRLSMKSEIPFAPFLIIGFFIVLFTGLDLFFLEFVL